MTGTIWTSGNSVDYFMSEKGQLGFAFIARSHGCVKRWRDMKPITTISDPRYVKAMSHPLRVRILALLDERTASPVELAGWLDASLGTLRTTCARSSGWG